MKYTKKQLREIYDATGGHCHLCSKKLAFTNYADFGAKGAWEVDHSNPRVNGGTNHQHNLKAACISCNRKKKSASTRVCRKQHGLTTAPESRLTRQRKKAWRELAGATLTIAGCLALCVISGGKGASTIYGR